MSARGRLLVDTRWTGQHGIGRYAHEIISRLQQPWEPLALRGRASQAQDVLRHRRARATDVLYSPGYNGTFTRGRYVLTVHDLIHLQVPSSRRPAYLAYYNGVARPLIRRSGIVLTVSETSRSLLREWIDDDDVDVVNAGIGVSACFTPDGTAAALSTRPYFLFVGNLRPHKNLRTVISAMRGVRDTHLLLLAPSTEHDEIRRIADASGTSDQIMLLPAQSDANLAALYRSAAATLMPSTHEGFGLPAAESIACGTPVLYWDGCASVREIVDTNGASVLRATDPDEWAARMNEMLSAARPPVVARDHYSWERAAKRVDAALTRMTDI